MQPFFVNTDIEAVEDISDYFAECKGNYREVVAFKAKHGHADDDAEDSRHDYADHDSNKHSERVGFNAVEVHRLRSDNARKCADAHKARMTEAQVAEDTDGEVKRHRHNGIGADGDKLTLEGA